MPGGDRTGPIGYGPMTGRRMGYCSGYQGLGYWHPGPGFGRGFGRGLGLGMGRGRRQGGYSRFGGYPYPPMMSFGYPYGMPYRYPISQSYENPYREDYRPEYSAPRPSQQRAKKQKKETK